MSVLAEAVAGTLTGLFVVSPVEEFSLVAVSSSSIEGQLAVVCSVLLSLSFKAFIARFLEKKKRG